MASYTRTLSRFSRCFHSLTPADLHRYQRPKQRPKGRSVAVLQSLSRCGPRQPRPAPHPHSTWARAPVHRISSPTAPIRPPRTHGRFGRCPRLRRSARTINVPHGAAPPPGLTQPNCGPPPPPGAPRPRTGTRPAAGAGLTAQDAVVPESPPGGWPPSRVPPARPARGAVPGLMPIAPRKSTTPTPDRAPRPPGTRPANSPRRPLPQAGHPPVPGPSRPRAFYSRRGNML